MLAKEFILELAEYNIEFFDHDYQTIMYNIDQKLDIIFYNPINNLHLRMYRDEHDFTIEEFIDTFRTELRNDVRNLYNLVLRRNKINNFLIDESN